MKQAILITAYKNYNHLEEIINFFDENFDAKYPAYSGYDGPYYSAEAMNYMEVSFVKIKKANKVYKMAMGGSAELRWPSCCA